MMVYSGESIAKKSRGKDLRPICEICEWALTPSQRVNDSLNCSQEAIDLVLVIPPEIDGKLIVESSPRSGLTLLKSVGTQMCHTGAILAKRVLQGAQENA
jgi:hypothetical protein